MTSMRVVGLDRKPDAEEATLILQDFTECLGLAFVIPMNEANRLARVLGYAGCRCSPVYELLIALAGARLGGSRQRPRPRRADIDERAGR